MINLLTRRKTFEHCQFAVGCGGVEAVVMNVPTEMPRLIDGTPNLGNADGVVPLTGLMLLVH